MFGDEAILVIHLPGAIEELSDFHASFGIGSAQRSGGNIQEQFSQGSFFPDPFTDSPGLPLGDPDFHCSLL